MSIRIDSRELREREAHIAAIVEDANGKFGKNRITFKNGWIQYPFREMAIEALCQLTIEKSAR